MTDNQDEINKLLHKLDTLLQKQETFSKEVTELREELTKLKTSGIIQTAEENKPSTLIDFKQKAEKAATDSEQGPFEIAEEVPEDKFPKVDKSTKTKVDLEKFIGENLISKIGIGITVIGVSIGAKYSIDHDLISPLVRIILGYLVGLSLLGFGIKLKEKYENYSAVLVSGAMAIMYFMTFAAYSFYGLFPQIFAFAFMVILTAVAVMAAIKYNLQVIAHIGLVGAYAVPFLLSEGFENVQGLFSYMAIINTGILVIAFKKYWKPLYYSSFLTTWLMYISWFGSNYLATEFFGLALIFLSVFFAIFYLTTLVYKILQKQEFKIEDILLLLANAFIFYGIGYSVLADHTTGAQLLGLFTLTNAVIHFIVSVVIYRQKLADPNLLYLVTGLVLIFITITIPVQLNGNWVTLLWAGEAALLFWIGRTKQTAFYEKISYGLMLVAFLSIIQDWAIVYNVYDPENPATRVTPLFNINFLTSLLFIASFSFINFLNLNKDYPSPNISQKELSRFVHFSIPAILICTIYYAFRIEIATYWNQLYADSAIVIRAEGQEYPSSHWNYDLRNLQFIWIINYSLFFLTTLSFANIKKLKNQLLGMINLGVNTFAIWFFLTQGLYILSELRESYLEQSLSEHYTRSVFNIGIRHISLGFVSVLLVACYNYVHQEFIRRNFKMAFDILLYSTVLWVASSELIHWMDIAESGQSYKLGLSILWGIYSLLLIALGIWKNKKYLRIGAIGLFAVTLIKLFVYDIAHLDTIDKTILFVLLGVLLLIISFLYNKFKHLISNE